MVECKRCGSTKTVKNGMVRGKQRYLCKQCSYHFVEVDQREKDEATLIKALCTVYHALGVKKRGLIGEYLNRDGSLIHRWMNKKPIKSERRWKNDAEEYPNVKYLLQDLMKHGLGRNGKAIMADNVVGDLYIAVIVQRRRKR